MESLVSHISAEIWHILAEIFSFLHPFRYPPGCKVMPQDIGRTVFKIVWVPCQLPAPAEKYPDISCAVLLPVAVREKYRCARIQAAGNSVIFLAHFHDGMTDCDTPVLMPFRVSDINRIMDKVKVLPCEAAYFLRPHPRRILEPEKDSCRVRQERAAFVLWIMVSRLKKAPTFLIAHDMRHAAVFISKIIRRKYAGIPASHDLIFPM